MSDSFDRTARQPVLELRNIHKAYGPTIALDDTSIQLASGVVHALLGENGAGKSTLVKILSGTVRPTSGSFLMNGSVVSLKSPRDAFKVGISTAYQELSVLPQLTVGANLFAGSEPRGRLGFVTGTSVAERAEEVLTKWNLASIDPEAIVGALPLGVRQQIELVRALERELPILLLDEPTAALGAAQVRWLFEQISHVREQGGTTLFISHRMGEVREMCDHVTVLRNGRDVGHFPAAQRTNAEVVQLMAGHALESSLAAQPDDRRLGEPVLTVSDLRVPPGLESASFEIRKGEIVGIAALQGHGQAELFNALFGVVRPRGGTISVNGRQGAIRSPHDAVRNGVGISLVPEDRKSEGVMVGMSGLANLTLPYLHRFSRFGLLRKRKERSAASTVLTRLNVRSDALLVDVSALSGGNQQKIAIGKWLLADCEIMLLFDPTRGVDVGTKAEIFELMQELVNAGRSILFYSTDVDELVSVADRIVVLYKGAVTAELRGEQRNAVMVLRKMLGARDEEPVDIPDVESDETLEHHR